MTPDDAPAVHDPPIDGHCNGRASAVIDAFRENFTADGDWGAAVCVLLEGQCIVDLWGGYRDEAQRRPWTQDTLVNAYSTGKGVLTMLVLDAVERGELSLDARIAALWPEFASHGKAEIDVTTLMSHKAGLPALRPLLPPAAKYDWARMCALLAAERPFWQPGSTHGYHSNTFGFLVGEVLRRATGLPVERLLRERLAGPAQADFHWGLPVELHARVAPMLLPRDISIETQQAQGRELAPMEGEAGESDHAGMVWRGYFNPPGLSGFGAVNTRAWRNAVIPSTNGHANARALARLYDALLHGIPQGRSRRRLASGELRAEATRVHAEGHDFVLERESRFALGFQLPQPRRPLGPNPEAFGHFGHGGSLGFADPERGLAFGYVTNRPGPRFLASRALRLIEAVYEGL